MSRKMGEKKGRTLKKISWVIWRGWKGEKYGVLRSREGEARAEKTAIK
jgi:hypothetical protein